MKKIIYAFLLLPLLFASCATMRTYVDGVEEYEKQEITVKGNRLILNDANTVSWGDRSLKLPETIQVSTGVQITALSYVKSWEKVAGVFSQSDEEKFPTEIYITDTRKDFLVEKEKVHVVLSTGIPKVEFELCDEDVVCSLPATEEFPDFKIIQTWDYQKGEKVSRLWHADKSSGYIVSIGGENYALIDILGVKPSLYLNKSFSGKYSESEQQFADSVVMALYYILDKMNGTLSADS